MRNKTAFDGLVYIIKIYVIVFLVVAATLTAVAINRTIHNKNNTEQIDNENN